MNAENGVSRGACYDGPVDIKTYERSRERLAESRYKEQIDDMDARELKIKLIQGKASLEESLVAIDAEIVRLQSNRKRISDDARRQEGGILACDEMIREEERLAKELAEMVDEEQKEETSPEDDAPELHKQAVP